MVTITVTAIVKRPGPRAKAAGARSRQHQPARVLLHRVRIPTLAPYAMPRPRAVWQLHCKRLQSVISRRAIWSNVRVLGWGRSGMTTHQDPPSTPSVASPVALRKRAGMHLTITVAAPGAEAAAVPQERAHLRAPVAYGTPCLLSIPRLPILTLAQQEKT